jgi:5-oxoprolinase (ATP-hydrolysing)
MRRLKLESIGMIKAVSRGTSTTADAYLTPILKDYINGFFQGFEGGEEALKHKTEFMMSGMSPR